MTDLMESPLTAAEEERGEVLRSWHNVARSIAEWRAARQLTQHELACRAGTKQSRISELESARGNVRFDTLNRVTEALGLEITLRERQPLPACTALAVYDEPTCLHFQKAIEYVSCAIVGQWATLAVASKAPYYDAMIWMSTDPDRDRLFHFDAHALEQFQLVDESATDDIAQMLASLRSRTLPRLPAVGS
jgi:transcriptional regulator with XRE-family HTH domain